MFHGSESESEHITWYTVVPCPNIALHSRTAGLLAVPSVSKSRTGGLQLSDPSPKESDPSLDSGERQPLYL